MKKLRNRTLSSELKIAYDLDDSILDFTRTFFLDFCNPYLGRNIKYESILSQNYWEILDLPKIQAIDLVHQFQYSNHFSNLSFIEGADIVLPLLKERYGKFLIVTSRDPLFKNQTENHLERILPRSVERVYYSNGHYGSKGKNKAEICGEIGANIIIEDNVHYAEICSNAGIHVLLLDKPWNQGFSCNNLRRVRNWNEIKDILLTNNISNEEVQHG